MEIPYILISIIVLLVIGAVIFFVRKDKRGKPLTPLASLSLLLVIMGIIFGGILLLVNPFIGIGVFLLIIIAYPLMGFIMVAIMALLYNFAAGKVGGVKIELK